MKFLCEDTSCTRMANEYGLSLCSFNCRSVKSSIDEVYQLCASHSFVFLQEHWLLPNELSMLSAIHPDFIAFSHSSVDLSNGILVGRSFGGTAVLFRKQLASAIRTVPTHDPRITALLFDSSIGPILLACVYMPTDYQDEDSLVNYMHVCGELQSVITECSAIHTILIGDFNCHSESRFFSNFTHLLNDHSLVASDIKRLTPDSITYLSDSGCNSSWIDHILCSNIVDSLILDIRVLLDFISSDHKPLSVLFMSSLSARTSDSACQRSNIEDSAKSAYKPKVTHCWNMVNEDILTQFSSCLDDCLCDVVVPANLLSCCDSQCVSNNHITSIDTYFSDIQCKIQQTLDLTIPTRVCNYASDYIIPGWNEIVQEKHAAARLAFREWVHFGKPKFGIFFLI
jgi:exonuclease III